MSRKTHDTSHHRTRAQPAPSQSSDGPDDAAHTPAAHAFLVRLWKETRDHSGRRPVWRGTLSNLQGHSVGSFGSVEELGDLLARATGDRELLLRGGDDPASTE